MFKFLPTTALPGFRVGLADGDEPGFNVANDGPPPVLPGAADAPIVDDNYPFGATSVSFNAPQTPVLIRLRLPASDCHCRRRPIKRRRIRRHRPGPRRLIREASAAPSIMPGTSRITRSTRPSR